MGGYTNANGLYHGRTAHWVYGQGTAFSSMSASFTVQKKPNRPATIVIVGLDAEDEAKSRMRLVLNNRVSYEGPDPLPNNANRRVDGPGNWGNATVNRPAQ